MQTHKAKLAKGRKTQVKTKLCGLINHETFKQHGFWQGVAITSKGELFIYVQSSTKSGRSTYRVDLVEVQDVRNG